MICLALALLLVLCLYPDVVLAATEGTSDLVGSLTTFTAVLAALSVASERFVEIIKGFSTWLSTKKEDDPDAERERKLVLQGLAVAGGILASLLCYSAIEDIMPKLLKVDSLWKNAIGIVALGLLTSGGSGFWNSFNTWVLEVKNKNKELAKKTREEEEERKKKRQAGGE